MSNLSRRNVVASAVALPAAFAVPAFTSFSPDHPDAELLRLALELEVVAEEHRVAAEASDKISAEWDAACDRAGLPRELHWPDVKDTVSAEEFYRRNGEIRKARNAIPHGDADLTDQEGETIWDKLGDRRGVLVEQILAIKPQTLDGLRVHARAVALDDPELWARAEDSSSFSGFLASVFAFLGLDDDGKPITRLI